MAGETIRQFIKDLYQENKLVNGNPVIGDKEVKLRNISCPLLNVYAEYDHLVPPEASIALNKQQLDAIIEAGIYSPSAMNQQPWHFAVVTNKELLDELSTVSKEVAKKSGIEYIEKLANNENYHIFYNAPVGIVVSIEQGKYEAEVDCAAATENMLIAAESFDLASCWIGFISFLFKTDKDKAKEYAKKLGIPEGYMPSHAVALGHKKNNNLKAPARRENTVSYIK